MQLSASKAAWAAELAIWLVLPAVFLPLYASQPQVPAVSAAVHVLVMALAWLALAIARLVAAMMLPARALRAVSCALLAAALLVVVAYDVLVIVGLHLWGRVVTWDMIASYGRQIPMLADVLGVPLGIATAALAGAGAATAAATWLYLGRHDWVAARARSLPGTRYVAVVIGCSLLCASAVLLFTSGWGARAGEPVSLTFYPEMAPENLQGLALDRMRSDQLDAVADEARAAYTINPYADRKNVVLIVVDALRADHMGVYGYSRPTTPALSRLAGSGAVRIVNEVRASCSSTVCGVRSLLTSRFAYQMSRRPITLHEVLKRYGYRVHVMIGDDHIHFYGLRGTYGEVDSYFDTAAPLNHPYTADDRLVLDRAAALPRWDGTPQLLHFHLISVHTLGRRDPRYARYTPAANYVVPGARNAASAKNYYDNGVLQADAVIGELLSTLDVKGYLRDALVVITADHGESLGEGGRYTHARGLTEEVLRIPLLFIAYGYKPASLAADLRLASQVDVAPTVLRELRMDRPRTWVGSPLQDRFSRDFTYLEEVDAVGLIDHRDPARLWKYWVERGSGREHVLDMTAEGEGETPLQAVPPQLRTEWRRLCMHLAAGASPYGPDHR